MDFGLTAMAQAKQPEVDCMCSRRVCPAPPRPLAGCTLEELWRHLSTHHPSQMTLDDTSKAFLWRSFLRPGQKEVQFFELPEDRPLPPLEEGKPSTTLPHRYSPVCDRESGVVGSCTTYNTRQDCTAHLKENTPSLQDAEQRCVCVCVCVCVSVGMTAMLASPPILPGTASGWSWWGCPP